MTRVLLQSALAESPGRLDRGPRGSSAQAERPLALSLGVRSIEVEPRSVYTGTVKLQKVPQADRCAFGLAVLSCTATASAFLTR